MRYLPIIVLLLLAASVAPARAEVDYGPHITAYPQEPFRTIAANEITAFTVDIYSTAPAIERARVEIAPTPGLRVIGVLWSYEGAPDCRFTPAGGLWCTYATRLGMPLQLDVLVAATAPVDCLDTVGLHIVATAGDRQAEHRRARLARSDRACVYLPALGG